VSPDPFERLWYPFKPELAHPIMRVFVEMQPLHRFLLTPPYSVALVYLLVILVALTLVLRFRQYRLWEVGLLVGLGLLASLAYRSLQDWILISLALAVPQLTSFPRALARHSRSASCPRWIWRALRLERRCKRLFAQPSLAFQWFWPASALGVLAILSLVPPLGRRMPKQDAADWPTGAASWIEAHRLRGNVFAPADYGAYITWRLGDNVRAYVDTRGFFFPPELLEDSHFLPQFTPDWPARLERVLGYGTDYFLLETSGPRGEMWRTLRPHLGEPLFLDECSVLLSAEQVCAAVACLPHPAAMRDTPRNDCLNPRHMSWPELRGTSGSPQRPFTQGN
jgi:hypothetical protein